MSDTEELAAAAARWVVDEGLDYAAAKQRAARELGRRSGRRGALPSDEAVEDQVRDYISLFHADTQPGELLALRRLALRWMQRLAEFQPHLCGAAWRGTATRRSALRIDLYADDAKATEIAFLNLGLDFDSGGNDADGPVVLSLEAPCPELGESVSIHFVVNDRDDLRGALKPDSRGQTWRGSTHALARLLESENP